MDLRPVIPGACITAFLLAFLVAWVEGPACVRSALDAPSRPVPGNGGLRPAMTVDAAEEVLAAWGTPFEADCGGAGPPVPGCTGPTISIALGRGPSPFGLVARGSLVFLEGRLFFADLEIEGSVLAATELAMSGAPSARRFPERCGRQESPGGWTCLTGGWTRHHVTLAFHHAALAGAIPEGEARAAEAAYEAEIAEAFEEPPEGAGRGPDEP